jgi:hypothetical protein
VASSYNVSWYASDLFNADVVPPYDDQLTELTAIPSGASLTINFWSIHVDSEGTLSYNNSPMVKNGALVTSTNPEEGVNPQFIAYANKLYDTGLVSSMALSIGAGSTDPIGDFNNLRSQWTQASANLAVLFNLLPGIDCVDFDFEASLDPADARDLVTDLTIKIAGLRKSVSYCPFQQSGRWADVLAAVYKRYRSQPVVRWNLQTYGSADVPDFYEAAKQANAGVTDLGTFIVPGYKAQNPNGGSCPSDVQSALSALTSYGLSSAFIYNTGITFTQEHSNPQLLCGGTANPSPSDYASAIVNGLGAANAVAAQV